MVFQAQVAQAAGEKVGKAKGEKKCSQFIVLYRCCSRYCNALERLDGREDPLCSPTLRARGKKGRGKWRLLLKNSSA